MAAKQDTGVSALTRGSRLGKYRLYSRLDHGGSSEVWKARDCVEGVWVALKIPLRQVRDVRDAAAFSRELRLLSKLRHRHIMPLKNADIIDGCLVLATELSVRTLDDCSRPMSVRRILSVLVQVLDGLAYAHRNRLVHCDVTPGNIFLFPNGHAALGDFGISLELKGKPRTIDDFGTPGYVAPEQAYGRPTYRSDCFAVGLILYEFVTGVLPRWPFRWPLRGQKRFRELTSAAMTDFIRKALAVDPQKRFADAGEMLTALLEATPKALRKKLLQRGHDRRSPDWRKLRRQSFVKRYAKVLNGVFDCVECGEPITEAMALCPWCGTDRNRFDDRSRFDYVCPRCHKGVLAEWRFCPWCYGAGFAAPSRTRTKGVRYSGKCRYCGGELMRFMRYCPWCRRKVRRPWYVRPFPQVCGRCGWAVDTDYWHYCPWCGQALL